MRWLLSLEKVFMLAAMVGLFVISSGVVMAKSCVSSVKADGSSETDDVEAGRCRC